MGRPGGRQGAGVGLFDSFFFFLLPFLPGINLIVQSWRLALFLGAPGGLCLRPSLRRIAHPFQSRDGLCVSHPPSPSRPGELKVGSGTCTCCSQITWQEASSLCGKAGRIPIFLLLVCPVLPSFSKGTGPPPKLTGEVAVLPSRMESLH